MQTNFSEILPYKQYRRYNCIVIFSKYRIEVFNYQYRQALAHAQHVDTHNTRTHTHTHTHTHTT